MGDALAGRASVITGGASGMGRATAIRFAAEGSSVVVTDVDDAGGAETVAIVEGRGGQARFVHLDVSEEDQWVELQRTLQRRPPTALVHCAGIGSAVGGGPSGAEAYSTFMRVNGFGTMLALRTAVALMRESGGSIVTIASVTAIRALDSADLNIGYGASKSAVRMLTHAIAKQEGRHGIRANCILPGFMPPMRGSRMPLGEDGASPYVQEIPLGRIGTVEDVASAALFLASDQSGYISGIDLPVDGGYLA